MGWMPDRTRAIEPVDRTDGSAAPPGEFTGAPSPMSIAASLPCNYTAVVVYEVQTPVFEGPFDLLLHLILDQKVDLFDVRLADIVDAYVAELERLARLELDVATEFLLIAATLVELKARRLLPDLDDPDLDDELALWEERDLLLARLLECRTFKDVARRLEQRMDEAGRSAARGPSAPTSASPTCRRPTCSTACTAPRAAGPRLRGLVRSRRRHGSTSPRHRHPHDRGRGR